MTDKAAIERVEVIQADRDATDRLDSLGCLSGVPGVLDVTATAFARHRLAFSRPSPIADQEAVARIIDPFAAECLEKVMSGQQIWREKHGLRYEHWKNRWEVNCKFGWEKAIAKADQIIALRALASSPVQDGWMPIETAPKDGRGILVIDMTAEKPEAGNAWWLYDVWTAVQPIGAIALGPDVFRAMTWPAPTHWRPLPAAPAADGGKDGQ